MTVSWLGIDIIHPVTIRPRRREFTSDTVNLKSVTVSTIARRLEYDVTLDHDSAGELSVGAIMSAHRARVKRSAFAFPMVQHLGIEAPNNTIQVVGNPTAGTEEITLRGNRADVPPIGIWIQFSNHRVPYQIVAWTTTQANPLRGTATLDVPLRQNVANNTGMVFSGTVNMKYSAALPEQVVYQDRALVSMTVNLIEAV